ncbi:MAG TPA: DUF3263 domain-containing protein [Actinomycetota bacterium]|nr:DUF3263 domain-containing protein [Actinomycetota bacterium]
MNSSSTGEGHADAGERWREVLDFERTWWKAGASKDAAIRDRLGMAPTRYYQVLNRAIDLQAALEYDPMLVRRLRRLRDRRRRIRFPARAPSSGAGGANSWRAEEGP